VRCKGAPNSNRETLNLASPFAKKLGSILQEFTAVWNVLRLFSPPGRLAIDKQTRMCVLGQGKRCTSPESYLFPSKIKVLRLNFLRRHVALSTTGAELAILCLIYESDRCEIPGVAVPGARGLTGGT
jgi:hypothetical protein